MSKSKLQKSTSTTYPEGKVIQGQKALLSKKTAWGISRTDSREEARLRPAPTPLRGASLRTHRELSLCPPADPGLQPFSHAAGCLGTKLPQKAFGQPQPWCSSSRFLDAPRLTSPLLRTQLVASSTAPHSTWPDPIVPSWAVLAAPALFHKQGGNGSATEHKPCPTLLVFEEALAGQADLEGRGRG